MEVVDDDKLFEILLKAYPGKIVTRQTFRYRRDDIQQFQIYDNQDFLIKDLVDHFKERCHKKKDKYGKYFSVEEGFIIIDDDTDIEFSELQINLLPKIQTELENALERGNIVVAASAVNEASLGILKT